jgi:hypothetical protein
MTIVFVSFHIISLYLMFALVPVDSNHNPQHVEKDTDLFFLGLVIVEKLGSH